ncbi:bud site selection-related protein [Phaffia rhodozyma]|uniref:Bud site selection-related protein n=1 Tax=Phaffia rhodozyma TaxID=264483 RepID=A0A0F7ST03_PHARH|nr:bud site selection-related protein [Phaffia rhodozyma]
MGRLRRSRTHKAQRDVHRAARTRARTRDLDLIQKHDLDPMNRKKLEAQELDEDKPGLGQHYCVECARYMETDAALKTHWTTKLHKRRCKTLLEPAHTPEESARAAGLQAPDNRQRGPEEIKRFAPAASAAAAGEGMTVESST